MGEEFEFMGDWDFVVFSFLELVELVCALI